MLFPFTLRKAQSGQHGAYLRLDSETVAGAKLAFSAMKAVGHLRVFGAAGVEFGHAARQVFLLRLQCAQAREHSHALGEDGAAGERKPFLGKVPDGDSFLRGDGARIEALHPAQDLEQRGFPCAIGADDADAFVGCDQPVDRFKKDFGAVPFACPGELNHSSFLLKQKSSGSRGPTRR